MNKHTPEPWKYALAFENNAPNYYAVCAGSTFGGQPIAKVWNEADAKLITASPKLLAALRVAADRLSVVIESDNEDRNGAAPDDIAAYKAARVAIKAAT
jgi:hypothetical protein